MITELEEQLSSVCNGRKQHGGLVDVTLPFQVIFSNKDRNIVKAKLRFNGPGRDAFIVMVVGLRSDILSGFDRFERGKPGRFMPCDLLGIVPGFALMVSSYSKGLALSTVARDEATRLILLFEGTGDAIGGSLRDLATSIFNYMKTWDEWVEVLLGILRRDSVVGKWNIDIREFLAGESGFETMPWFRPMSYDDRSVGLERVVMASCALINSVLDKEQMSDPLIVNLRQYLNDLRPLPEVVSSLQVGEEASI
jgi:hypothetical protein